MGTDEEIKEDSTDYSSMKVAELKELLKERELPVSGTKSELIERLQTWIKRPGSFYHSGSQSHKLIVTGLLYLLYWQYSVLIGGIGNQVIGGVIGSPYGLSI